MLSEMDLQLLDMQAALLDAVVPELRAVTVDIDIKKKELVFCFFYDANIIDELFELASVASTEASCSFPDYFIKQEIIYLPFPKEIPVRGKLAYLREERVPQKITREERPFLSNQTTLIAALLLALQQALLGKVTQDLRAVTGMADERKKLLIISYIYDGEISKKKLDLAKKATDEVRQLFPGYIVEEKIDRIDFPNKINYEGVRIAFSRNEKKIF